MIQVQNLCVQETLDIAGAMHEMDDLDAVSFGRWKISQFSKSINQPSA
jgi:hypothetical protein